MTNPQLPTILTMEHESMQNDLDRAARAGGETEKAAWQVTRVLFPHVYREEEFAIPPLVLLPRLARGQFTPDMESILAKTEVLKAEMPRMLAEHKAIVAALRRLLKAATDEGHPELRGLRAEAHPARADGGGDPLPASLVGEFVKMKLGAS
jgi:hypothetical protein